MAGNSEKKWIIQAIFILAGIVLLARLYMVQVVDEEYKELAESNVVRKMSVYPARGLVFDRNNRLIVKNEPVYDLMVVPRQVKSLDTTKFCQLLDIDLEFFNKEMKKARYYSWYKASTFMTQIPLAVFTRFQEYLYQFPGFYPEIRTVRNYSESSAPHVLGYVGEINPRQLKESQEDSTAYNYQLGDYIGQSGLEKTYEPKLRGERGYKFVTVDAYNREKGSYKSGTKDKPAQEGVDINITLDLDLQIYAEELMQNKIGGLVAIEPSTGEILALVSSPYYNPQLLSGRERGNNFKALNIDTTKPLLNRAIQGQYPPGSTFKSFVALVGLQEKMLTPYTYFYCGGYYRLGSRILRCSHGHESASTIRKAIEQSCNPYFWQSFRKFIDAPQFETPAIGLAKFNEYLYEFGIGKDLHKNIDIPGAKKSNVPTVDFYDRLYGSGRWRSSTIISLGIGQGELGLTPLELANMAAVIANRGYYYYPHIIKQDTSGRKPAKFLEKNRSSIEAKHFETVVVGMHDVVETGTAKVAQIEGIEVCGKTGTSQNPHGDDHSVFFAFAPKDDPKIAIAVVVENGGYGSRYAAPISSLVIEKYLKGEELSPNRKWWEKRMFDANLINPETDEKKE